MRDLNKLLKTVQKMPKEQLFVFVQETSLEIIPALQALSGETNDSVMVYCLFLHGVLAADGRLADEEYVTIEPLCKALFGDSFDYASCKTKVENMAYDDSLFDQMVQLVKVLPEEVATNLILVTIAICAIDGKISKPEKALIERLIY